MTAQRSKLTRWERNPMYGAPMAFIEHTCPSRGIEFAIPGVYHHMLKRGELDEDGERRPRRLYCPNGHKSYLRPIGPADEETEAPPASEGTKPSRADRKHQRRIVSLAHDLEVAEARLTDARAAYQTLWKSAEAVCGDRERLADELARRQGKRPARCANASRRKPARSGAAPPACQAKRTRGDDDDAKSRER